MHLIAVQEKLESQFSGEVFHPLIAGDREVVAAIRTQAEPIKGTMSGPDARDAYDAIMEQTPDALDVAYERGEVGGVPGIWCRSQGAGSDVVILYLHGGGYVLGTAQAYRHLAGQIATRANANAFVPDYRLAPEYLFPAAVDDALAVYRGLVAAGAYSIAIVGDSAGGGLALALLTLIQGEARDGAEFGPAAAVALSPWTDLALTGASIEERADEDPILTPATLATMSANYLLSHDPRDPLASPLNGILAGLPPIQIHVGTSEILLDDSRLYVEKARAEGVDATLHIWEGMLHVFPSSVGALKAAEQALDMAGEFLNEKLGRHAA
jgi:monoterpene epsilon-lactone hydrolase